MRRSRSGRRTHAGARPASSDSTAARLDAGRGARQASAARFRRPRPPQPPRDERLLARPPPRRLLAQAGALRLGGAQRPRARGGPVRRPDPAGASAERARRDPLLARLGPDILAPDFDPIAVASALARPRRARSSATRCSTRRLVAGIGNIFKSEACFAARLDPWREVGRADRRGLERVLGAARAADVGRGARPPPPRRLPQGRPALPPAARRSSRAARATPTGAATGARTVSRA